MGLVFNILGSLVVALFAIALVSEYSDEDNTVISGLVMLLILEIAILT